MSDEPGAVLRGTLNEHQQRHLLVSCQYIDKLLGEIEQIAHVPSAEVLFPRHSSTMTSMQKRVLQDYLSRIRSRVLAVLDGEHLQPPPPQGQDVFSIRSTLGFVDIAIEELKPKYMRGYGAVPEAIVPRIEGIVDELRTVVQKLTEYLAEDPDRNLQARLARLEHGCDGVQSLVVLERIITSRGLVDFRPRLTMLVDRASSCAFEIAVFGRVSSGKSSLLNCILESPVLPVGATPVTAVPTRIVHGPAPALRVSFADRPDATLALDRLSEYVTEQQNPGNARHVVGLIVELPARRLHEGVVFVDTPGLGSLARAGAQQTLAYLPRCDLGAVLVDAGSTLTPDDLLTVHALYEATIPATVLLSKADLLAPDERERAVAYIADQLHRELNIDACVHPVSVMPGHQELLNRWFASGIEPLYERHQEAARTSLRRKIGALREAVQASLRVQLGRRVPFRPVDQAGIEEAEQELRRTAGLFAPTARRCEELSRSIGALGADILRQTARRLLRDEPRAAGSPPSVEDELALSVQDVLGERVDRIHLEVSKLGTATQQALNRSGSVLRLPMEPVPPAIDGLPPLAFTFSGLVVPRGSCLAFSRSLHVRYLEHALRQRVAVPLDEALVGHAAIVTAWARRAVEATRAAFEGQAEPLRSAFADASRPTAGRAAGDEASGLERDLEELDELAESSAPTDSTPPSMGRTG